MMLYDVLKASKGLYVDDSFAMLWGKQLGGWKIAELTGTLPMTFRSNGTALINYRIYGTAEGAGVQTENLIEGIVEKANISDTGIIVSHTSFNMCVAKIVEGQKYTITTSASSGFVYGLFRAFPAINSQSYDNNRIIGQRTFTAPIDGYIAFRTVLSDTLSMFTEGSTSPETFIPYGYKLPLTVTSGAESKDTDIYIGDSKLLSNDYVNYETGKIVRNGTPQDPPLPLPAIETFSGENTLDSTETLGEVTIKGRIKEAE